MYSFIFNFIHIFDKIMRERERKHSISFYILMCNGKKNLKWICLVSRFSHVQTN